MVPFARMIGQAMTFVSIALMIFLSLPIAFEAISRFFGAPTIWVFETTLYAFVFLGFLGNALAVRTGAHFRVTLLRDLLPRHAHFFDRIAEGATMLFALLIIGAGLYFVHSMFVGGVVSDSLLEVPLWVPALAIPLGGLGLFLQTLVQTITGEVPVDHVAGD